MRLKQNEVKMFVITREICSRAANAKLSENVRNKKVFVKLQEKKPPLPVP
jgi:hypothetical protein